MAVASGLEGDSVRIGVIYHIGGRLTALPTGRTVIRLYRRANIRYQAAPYRHALAVFATDRPGNEAIAILGHRPAYGVRRYKRTHCMNDRIATARPFACALAATVAVSFALVASAAFAQQPAAPAQAPAAPAAKPAAPKPAAAAPKPAAPVKPGQAQTPAPAPAAQPDQAAGDQPQLIYSPWVKICNKADAAQNQKAVCVTAKDGRLENGMPVAAAALIEPEGEPRKLMRITVPLGMQLQHGTRMILDTEQPMTAPYFLCFPNGCMADYEASVDMVGKMKKGKQLTIQAINMNGTPISLPLPLADFAKAYDGPPTDPKVLEEQQRKLQEELQKKAEEARKKLEGQQPSAAAPAAPKQ